ncbi:hypothetical protein B0T18DRAFT_331686, partial [Schizothecium vesticola]
RQKTYSTRDSLVVTDPTTSLAVRGRDPTDKLAVSGLSLGERTGSHLSEELFLFLTQAISCSRLQSCKHLLEALCRTPCLRRYTAPSGPCATFVPCRQQPRGVLPCSLTHLGCGL